MPSRLETGFTLAAAGDAIITRRLSRANDPGLGELVDRIRAADASVVNLETTTHDFEGYPAPKVAGLNICSPPWVIDELDWAGFDLFAAANNHSGDYSHGGVEATMRELDERGASYAGLGGSLAEARAPTYVDTPAGRVALVAACTTIPSKTEAGASRADMQGRPGLSPLRLETEYVLPEEDLEALRGISEKLGLEDAKAERFKPPVDESGGGFDLVKLSGGLAGAGTTVPFEPGDEPAIRHRPDADDADAILDRVDEAARQADWVVASLHTHEGEGWRYNHPSVPSFLEGFARDCVDAGADAFVSHGPHLVRGIEVYDGAPVFYSLGNFVSGQESMTRVPQDLYDMYGLGPDATPADVFDERYFEDDGGDASDSIHPSHANWESVLPVCGFEDGALDRVTLYPVDLGVGHPRPRRGQPTLAEGEAAERILENAAELSEPYGTDVEVADGVGIIRP